MEISMKLDSYGDYTYRGNDILCSSQLNRVVELADENGVFPKRIAATFHTRDGKNRLKLGSGDGGYGELVEEHIGGTYHAADLAVARAVKRGFKFVQIEIA